MTETAKTDPRRRASHSPWFAGLKQQPRPPAHLKFGRFLQELHEAELRLVVKDTFGFVGDVHAIDAGRQFPGAALKGR